MRCLRARKLSTEYLDGHLDDDQSSAVRGHLRECTSCRDAFADEATLRDAAESLPRLDPPADLWQRIESRIASEEVADSHRAPWWLWMRGQWVRWRVHALGASLAAAAIVFVMLQRADEGAAKTPTQATLADAPPPGPALSVPERSFDEARKAEVIRADARYLSTIDELLQVALAERPNFSPAQAKAFDAAMDDFHRRADRFRTADLREPGAPGGARDELYAVYREQIDFLSRVAVGDRW